MLPRTVAEVSPLDPLLLLPLPHDLPTPPELALDQVLADIAAQLNQLNHPSDITLLTSRMRMLTRHAQVLLNSARVGAAEARERLDTVDVSLKGVEYEHDRVRDEIAKCLRYSPQYPDMDIPNAEEFLASTTVQIPQDESYEYALTIARLEHELVEIKKREEQVTSLKKEQESLIKAKKEIKHKFDAVDTYLSDYAKTTNAVARKLRDVL